MILWTFSQENISRRAFLRLALLSLLLLCLFIILLIRLILFILNLHLLHLLIHIRHRIFLLRGFRRGVRTAVDGLIVFGGFACGVVRALLLMMMLLRAVGGGGGRGLRRMGRLGFEAVDFFLGVGDVLWKRGKGREISVSQSGIDNG